MRTVPKNTRGREVISMGRFMMNRNQNVKLASFLMNAILVLGTFFVALNLVAPFFGVKLSVYAIVVHGNWIATSLVGKLFLNRIRKGLPIRVYEHVLGCLVGIVNLVGLPLPYPVGIIMSIFFIVGAVFVYRAQKRRLQKADPSEAQVSTGNKIKRIEE